MLKFLLHCKSTFALGVVVLTLWSFPGFAQDGNPSPPPGPSAANQQVPPAIQKELDALAARIEQLEAELKNTKAKEQPASAKAEVPAPATEEASLIPSAPAPAAPPTQPADPDPLSEPVDPGAKAAAFAQSQAMTGKHSIPFAFADFSWLNGNSREKDSPLDSKVFTGEFRADTSYIDDFAHPIDHTLVGSSESGRTNEVQVQQLGIGGDFHYDNVRGRLLTQFGLYSTETPRNDATPGRGQWDLSDAYRYLAEAYGGYHFDVLHGVNVDAGIFMSYIGLFSYYNYDNWVYQPSYVSSNTPWFFNGARIQIFPTEKLKIEPWLINGWQAYGTANGRPGLGLQVLWRPSGRLEVLGNQYGVGRDTIGAPFRTRYHTDDSIEYKYYDDPAAFFDKSAFSVTLDAGCESGSGVSCFYQSRSVPKQYFLGLMVYNRLWFDRDRYGLTLGGGAIDNPGRYLVLLPPINGATAFSGTPYFTENPGDPYKAWDASATFDYMPSQFITFRWEYDHRAANVPYFAGTGGVTPPGGNTGPPGSIVPGFTPDLRKAENRLNLAVLVKL